jgi:hypothetical protein
MRRLELQIEHLAPLWKGLCFSLALPEMDRISGHFPKQKLRQNVTTEAISAGSGKVSC